MRAMSCMILVGLLAGGATAHEQSLHKGHPTEGGVGSVSAQGFVLETEKGSVPVTVTDTTKIARGDTVASRAGVRTGDHVSVFGTKLATGELVAKEIVVHGPEREGGAEEDAQDHGQ